MKAFEEKFTAWIEGELRGEELASFEKELAAHPEAAQERADALQLRKFLRAYPTAPALTSGDFFTHQLTQRIVAESRTAAVGRTAAPMFWSLWRLLGASAVCLLMAAALFRFWIWAPDAESSGAPYFAQVVEAWPSDPSISATTVYSSRDNLTVLWLDGLEYIPANTRIQ